MIIPLDNILTWSKVEDPSARGFCSCISLSWALGAGLCHIPRICLHVLDGHHAASCGQGTQAWVSRSLLTDLCWAALLCDNFWADPGLHPWDNLWSPSEDRDWNISGLWEDSPSLWVDFLESVPAAYLLVDLWDTPWPGFSWICAL